MFANFSGSCVTLEQQIVEEERSFLGELSATKRTYVIIGSFNGNLGGDAHCRLPLVTDDDP
jgi:hypothetical protein